MSVYLVVAYRALLATVIIVCAVRGALMLSDLDIGHRINSQPPPPIRTLFVTWVVFCASLLLLRLSFGLGG